MIHLVRIIKISAILFCVSFLFFHIIHVEAQSDNPNSITITTPVAYQVFQRNANNHANITITGTYSGTLTAIEASWNGGSYTTIVASPAGGVFSGTLSNQTAGQGMLAVRFTNDTAASSSKSYVGIGDIFVIAGQSNASGRGGNNQSYSSATHQQPTPQRGGV